jgi:hypothetical protein
MAHYAKVENGLVTQVIVADQEFIDSAVLGHGWIQTSYNTRGGKHYDADGNEDNGVALRGNYAGIGYTYDATNDVFYAPQPYASWTLNQSTWTWEAPTSMPTDNKQYKWEESSTSWVAI